LFEGGSVVNAIAGHADDMTIFLQYFYDGILMLGEDLGEAIGLIDFLGSVQRDLPFDNIAGKEFRCRLDVCAHVQL